MVAWSLEALAEAEAVANIVIAAPPGAEAEFERIVAGHVRVVAGGATRSESVAAAVRLAGDDLVVVHDAARPLATGRLFDEVIDVLVGDASADAVVAAAPVTDTIKRGEGEHLEVTETLDREGLWAVQTPQAFRAEALRRAFAVPLGDLAAATDDAMLVERTGGTVRIHPAPPENLKVTTAADLRLAASLLGERASP
jgi:2-C-methyl-D-erythritol 4-phosphate cytidylyltransferase